MKIAYTRGLHELGDGLYAYLQPDGGWGWSNSGLITAPGTSMLIDTLFDLRVTREMLGAMEPVTSDHPIAQAMNTHGNGDHWFGNELLPDGIPIVTSRAALEEMRAVPPGAAQVISTSSISVPSSTPSPNRRSGALSSPGSSRGCRPAFEGSASRLVGDLASS